MVRREGRYGEERVKREMEERKGMKWRNGRDDVRGVMRKKMVIDK